MKISKRAKNSLAGYIKYNSYLSGKFTRICKWCVHKRCDAIYFVVGQLGNKYILYSMEEFDMEIWDSIDWLNPIPDEIIDQIKAKEL